MSDDKTEQPTERRLRDARKEGQVAQSSDLTSSVTMGCVVLLLALSASPLIGFAKQIVTYSLDFVESNRSSAELFTQLYRIGLLALAIILPYILAAALGALLASASQVGLQVSMTPALPKLSKINPGEGLKRMFSMETMTELIKMIIKATILLAVMAFTVRSLFPLIVASLYQSVLGLALMFWKMTLRLLFIAAVLFVATGASDFGFKKFFFLRKLRMSKIEIKRETKQAEGDPRIKGERKKRAREIADSLAPSASVGFANVLIVNPTHYAVALRYAPNEHALPRVIAKGSAEQAAVLRRAARDARVPIIGNPPVARALYQVGIEQPIPEELFETVAAILRWVQSIGEKRVQP